MKKLIIIGLLISSAQAELCYEGREKANNNAMSFSRYCLDGYRWVYAGATMTQVFKQSNMGSRTLPVKCTCPRRKK